MSSDTSRDRSRRLFQAAGTGSVARVLGAVVHLLAMPIGYRVLGTEGFIIYGLAVSAFAWSSVASLGITQGLAVRIAEVGRANRSELATLVGTSLTILAFSSAALATVLVALILLLGYPLAPNDFSSAQQADLKMAALVYGPYAVWQILSSGFFGILSGLQEQRLINYRDILANLTILFAVAVIFPLYGSAPAHLLLAVFGPRLAFDILNILWLRTSHRELFTALGRVDRGHLQALLRPGLATIIGGSVGTFLYLHAPVLIGTYRLTPNDTALLVIIMQVIRSFNSLSNSLTLPLVPALTEAIRTGDRTWVSLTLRRVFHLLSIALIPVAMVLVIFGNSLLTRLFNLEDSASQLGLILWASLLIAVQLRIFLYRLWFATPWRLPISISTACAAATMVLLGLRSEQLHDLLLVLTVGNALVFAAFTILWISAQIADRLFNLPASS